MAPRDKMTSLEEFLARAGVVEKARELERIYVYDNSPIIGTGMPVGVHLVGRGVSVGVDAGRSLPVMGMGLPLPVVDVGGSSNGRGREKKGLSSLEPVTRTERRVIKKREVAARARARMQAKILGLESRMKSLEEENDRLRTEKEQFEKERLKQLMEKVIPVVEKRRSPRVLRRVHSMEW